VGDILKNAFMGDNGRVYMGACETGNDSDSGNYRDGPVPYNAGVKGINGL